MQIYSPARMPPAHMKSMAVSEATSACMHTLRKYINLMAKWLTPSCMQVLGAHAGSSF
jgi:hypothetical protein